jgi:hypothetical protein
MRKNLVIILLIFTHFFAFSQKGKSGAGNIIASTVVNAYTALSVDAFIGNTTINVASSAGYAVGDLIYIIQMQGASVNCFINPFGNKSDFSSILNSFGVALQSPRRLINLNRQLNLVFRVITREMDSLPQIRPDNNY